MHRFVWPLALALAASVFAVGSPAPTSAATPFTDIADSKFRSDIEWAYATGITVGCSETRFCPKGLVTREQMASFLTRMFKLPTTSEDFFWDDNDSRHHAAINRVAAAGITVGCDTGKFCPKGLVNRDQMASFISRAAKLSVGAGRNYFWDDNGNRHELSIDKIAAAGITTGCGTYQYCPKGAVTREQMTAFLHRVVVPRTSPPYPAPPPPASEPVPGTGCDPSYPSVCIPPPPPDLDCGDIPHRRFTVLQPDPHRFDGDKDGVGCESG